MISTKTAYGSVSITSLLALSLGSCINQAETDLSEIQYDFRPNILWISCEDIGPYLPIYGDSTIETPNLERLAAEGIVFERAFAPTGQCAPTRHSIITGMHSTATSGSNMRTGGKQFPDSIHCFPEYLMSAGYYCSNNSKTDYNFSEPKHTSIWHESSGEAHWKKRPSGSPFFSVFNIGVTHESQFLKTTPLKVSPEKVPVPPYFPDTRRVREDIARNYSNIMELDSIVGQYLEELEKSGMADSTIVFFWSDHGGPLPRQKREVLESGIHVPFIVRFPDHKFAGTRITHPVSLVGLGPTVLSLAGIQPPVNMHGKALMGEYKNKDQEYVYGGFDRKAGTIDMVRYVRSKDYLYIHNYYPDLPHYARTGYRLEKIPMMEQILQMKKDRKLDQPSLQWFSDTKSLDELYDIRKDPHCMENLAGEPGYEEILKIHKEKHIQWFLETRDVGLFPESLQARMEEKMGMTMYSIMRTRPIPLEKIREVAMFWLNGLSATNELNDNLDDSLAVIRYHACLGAGNLAGPGIDQEALSANLKDEFPSVQLAAAYALIQLGKTEKGVSIFRKYLETGKEDHELGCVALSLIKRMENRQELFGPLLTKIQENIEGSRWEGLYFSQELDNLLLMMNGNH